MVYQFEYFIFLILNCLIVENVLFFHCSWVSFIYGSFKVNRVVSLPIRQYIHITQQRDRWNLTSAGGEGDLDD